MSDSPEPSIQAILRTSQIIAAALCLGVLFFLGIALYIVNVVHQGQGMAPAGDGAILAYMSAGFLAIMLLPALLVPRLISRDGVAKIARGEWEPPAQGPASTSDSGKLMGVRQTAVIIRMAMLEGASFFGGIAYLTQGHPVALGVMIAGLVLLMMQFPTQGRVQSWLNEQLEEIDRARLPS
jgi:hypothetical protein